MFGERGGGQKEDNSYVKKTACGFGSFIISGSNQ